MPKITRRDFLQLGYQAILAASGLLGVGAILRFLGHPTEPPPQTEFDLGPAMNYPPGSRILVTKVPAVVIHNEAGFSALSLICPHLGCTVENNAAGFACPCHGSKFNADGIPLNGPAGTPLAALQIEQNAEGHLILRTR